jgi:signal transduction histidine kinase
MAWLMLDLALQVLDGNELFWGEIACSEPAEAGTPLESALPEGIGEPIAAAVREAVRTRAAVEVSGLRVFPPGQPHRVVDVSVALATLREEEVLLVASSAVGDAGRRVEELTLLHDMIRVLRQQTEVERVLFTTLTCATAGSGGLGFNRAWVLLCDDANEWLEGAMALGPASEDDAHRIWAELTSSPRTLDQFADAYDRWVAQGPGPLQEAVRRARFSLAQDAGLLPVLALRQNRVVHVLETPEVHPGLADMAGAPELVIAPMVVGSAPRGVIMADNLYSRAPVTQAHVRLLSLFAQHAGMAIEDAQLHRRMEEDQRRLREANAELKKAQDEVLRTAKLAALGDMAARIAHDLRNPLVTLGGWARVMQEDPEDTGAVVTAARIIAEEAASLEAMLSMLLEPFSVRNLRLQPVDLNRLVEDTLQTHENAAQQQGVSLSRDYGADLPPVPADPALLRRCLTNLIDNALVAMPRGGTLSAVTQRDADAVLLEIGDTGIGMTEDQLPQIFDAFYTTGHFGSGLGLAIVWDIIQAHGFTIDVRSEPGQGSTFAIRLPLTETTGPGSDRRQTDASLQEGR